MTTNEVGDSPVANELLGQVSSHERVVSFTGDGAYDTQGVYEACHQRGAIPLIPPRKGARLRKGLIAMRPSKHASVWGEPSGNGGVAITDEVWWKTR